MTKQTVDDLSETTIPELILGAASQRITTQSELNTTIGLHKKSKAKMAYDMTATYLLYRVI